MNDQYYTNVPSYSQPDSAGLNPVFQDLSAQKAMEQKNVAAMQALGNQALSGGQYNPSDMANALRGNNPQQPTGMQNLQAYINSKFGRDELQPDTGKAAEAAQQSYGNTYNPNAGWSA